MNFKNWPIGRKLRFMNYVLLANMLLVGIVGYWGSSQLRTYLSEANHKWLPAIHNSALLDMYHDGLHGVPYQALHQTSAGNLEGVKALRDDIAETKKNAAESFNEIAKLDLGDEVTKAVESNKKVFDSYGNLAIEIIKQLEAGRKPEAVAKLSEFETIFEQLVTTLEAQTGIVQKSANESELIATRFAEKMNFTNLGFILLGLIVGLGLPWLIFRSLLQTMETTIASLTNESSEVSESSSTIRVSSENLSSATTEQASALQETASSIEEMNAMVKKSTENTSRSLEVSRQSHTAAEKGKEAVSHMMKAIEEINVSNDTIMKQTEESNKKISEIVKVIQEIGNKTKVINDIVFQTKLLSFNASVEAARAGEHGKGFAVVAEEVGNLAQMSGNAAKEISDMLSDSIKQVEGIITDTKRGIEKLVSEGRSKVEAGTVVARQCGEILEDVVKNVTHVDSMIQEISTATREQSQGINEITRAMNQLDTVTHQNSTTSNNVAASAEKLANQSHSLMAVVEQLKSFVHGGGSNDMPELRPVRPSQRDASPRFASTNDTLEKLRAMTPDPVAETTVQWAEHAAAQEQAPSPSPSRKVPGVSLMDQKSPTWKKAAGSLAEIPSEDDSRFKDF